MDTSPLTPLLNPTFREGEDAQISESYVENKRSKSWSHPGDQQLQGGGRTEPGSLGISQDGGGE